MSIRGQGFKRIALIKSWLMRRLLRKESPKLKVLANKSQKLINQALMWLDRLHSARMIFPGHWRGTTHKPRIPAWEIQSRRTFLSLSWELDHPLLKCLTNTAIIINKSSYFIRTYLTLTWMSVESVVTKSQTNTHKGKPQIMHV